MIINGFLKIVSVPAWNAAALDIAVHDMEALSRRRFGDSPAETAVRIVEEALPSFEVRFDGSVITIAAPNAVEAMYGVYDFAEKFLGFYFWAPGEDLLDATGPVELTQGILIPAREPMLKLRGFVQEFPFDKDSPLLADWMGKNKLNILNVWMVYYDALDKKGRFDFIDRGIEIQSGHHNFSYWIPSGKYRAEHPEYFAMIDGKRISPKDTGDVTLLGSEQLCTTNKDLRREIVKNMVKYAEENPEIQSVGLTPNDGFGWCECPECSKFYDKNDMGDDYSVSTHVYKADRIYHNMVGDVAAQLGQVRPDLKLWFGAYINYCRPAPGFKLTKNLAVSLAFYWRCINHTIDDPACDINSHYLDDLKQWVKAKEGGTICIYEYYMGVNFYLSLPMIHFHDIFQEVRTYREIGADGVFTQFHLPHWSVYGMNFRAMADALRGEDEATSVERLFRARFGADAEEAKALYADMRALLQSVGKCHIPYPYSLLSRTTLEQYKPLLEKAKDLLAKAPDCQFRKDLVIWCEYMLRFKTLFDGYHQNAITEADVDALLAWIHSHGPESHVFVQNKYDWYFQALKDAMKNGTPWLHFNIDWEDAYIKKHEKTLR